MHEAEVYIDGQKLTDAQVMTIRVAVESFRMSLSGGELSDLDHELVNGYSGHALAVSKMLVAGGNREDRLSASRRPAHGLRCRVCGDWALDGKATCGRATCGPSTGR